jgi:DNA adenine methylase
MEEQTVRFIRYPGGKQRIIEYIAPYLPTNKRIKGKYVEPFVGGGSIFFSINPRKALLCDINKDLIDLYRGIRRNPKKVWEIYKDFPNTKKAYYKIRNQNLKGMELEYRAARILYLNRTCFKGMWRHNSSGLFNVGYGGQDRRWAINEANLIKVSQYLIKASLKRWDFERTINDCNVGDFIFLDPPYKPGQRELTHIHYTNGNFNYMNQKRLANVLNSATKKGIKWAMTNSSHKDIISLFKNTRKILLPIGTGKEPGILTNRSGESLICNYKPEVSI